MKRYDFNDRCDGESGSCLEDMEESVGGEWVLYTDHRAECERMVREAIEVTHSYCILEGTLMQDDDRNRIVREVMGDGE